MTMVETASTTLMTRPTAAAPPEPTAEGRTMRLPGSAVVDRAVEVALGLVLATGFLPRITLLVLAGHLAGTFLSFVTASELMWGANLFQLTADGEFVAKKLVLITAALVLIGIYSRREGERAIA
jgi:uncharacterized membrane protein YphA (DoxX/SURF4 family)